MRPKVDSDDEEDEEPDYRPRRSERAVSRPKTYNETGRNVSFTQVETNDTELADLERSHNIQVPKDVKDKFEYYPEVEAPILAHLMMQIREQALNRGAEHASKVLLGPQLPIGCGMKKFGQRGYDATYKEAAQLHERGTFNPILPSTITNGEKKKSC